MGLDPAKTPGRPTPRWSAILTLLESRRAPAPAPSGGGDSGVVGLLDRLNLARRAGGADTVLARLESGPRPSALAPGEWQLLARAWAADPAGRPALAERLRAAGVTAESGQDGRYVAFVAGDLRVTAEPAANRLRRTESGLARCYEGDTLVRTVRASGNQVEVDDGGGRSVWDATSGRGTRDGVAIAPRRAAAVPGESPRSPWASPLSNDLEEPAWSAKTSMSSYAPAYDAAIREAGGRVLERSAASQPAVDQYNCHAYALTRGEGELFDPFFRETHAHWLNNPMHALTTGAFARLGDDQRVHPGDVIVYRKGDKVTHTGVVSAVDGNGNPTRIESKFGVLGRFMHEPFDVPAIYGAPAEFYRPEAE